MAQGGIQSLDFLMYFLVCPLPIVIIADFVINMLMKKSFITSHEGTNFSFDEARGLISNYPLLVSLSKSIYPEYGMRIEKEGTAKEKQKFRSNRVHNMLSVLLFLVGFMFLLVAFQQ